MRKDKIFSVISFIILSFYEQILKYPIPLLLLNHFFTSLNILFILKDKENNKTSEQSSILL